MRPNKFRSEVNKAIGHWLDTGSNAKFTPYLINAMKDVCEFRQIDECDYRTGLDTYGYESLDDIRSHMSYISDRWNCAFRLKWIIDGLEKGFI